jgi:hypothetical protein
MSSHIHAPSSLRRIVRQLRGLPVVAVRYVFQRVPLYRRDRVHAETPMPDLERELPGDPSTVQRASDGVGALFNRRYWIHVTDEQLTPEELIGSILHDPNSTTPTEFAQFETFDGAPAHDLDVGDELLVRLPGPWDGPIRIIERTPTSFRIATLTGHMEAGEIEFRSGYDDRGFLEFEIESWARSGDRVFDWLYERFPIGREMQLHMWSQVCQRVADAAGGVRMSNVACSTRKVT